MNISNLYREVNTFFLILFQRITRTLLFELLVSIVFFSDCDLFLSNKFIRKFILLFYSKLIIYIMYNLIIINNI